MANEYDVIVIGAGPAGEIAAARVADGGKRTLLVERELVGGECSYYACMPSKALLRPGELRAELARVPGTAPEVHGGGVDAQRVLARRDEVIHNLDDSDQIPWLDAHNISLARGAARLEGERRVRVGEDMFVARDAVVLATGSGAAIPPIPGLREAAPWSNREVTTAGQVPARLLVLGGGVVGVEMAQAWSSLGSQVTIVEALDRLIAREEPSASAQVQAGLERAGVTIRVGCKATAARRSGSTVELELESGECLTAEEILVAVGRRPHTADLGLETIGLEPGGYIEVDDTMRVRGLDWLYAVGDVNGRALLTHQGKYQGRVAGDNILGTPARATHDGAVAPRVIFTDPQVAAVGMTAAAADEAGISTRVIELATSGTAGASFYGRNTEGSTRFVVDAEREVLIGATFVGFEVADFLQAATIAVTGEVPLPALAHAVAPFPTRSEIWLKFVEAYEKERGVSLHAESARAAASLP